MIEHRLVSDTLRKSCPTRDSKLPHDELRFRKASSSDVMLLRDDLRRKPSGCGVFGVGLALDAAI